MYIIYYIYYSIIYIFRKKSAMGWQTATGMGHTMGPIPVAVVMRAPADAVGGKGKPRRPVRKLVAEV